MADYINEGSVFTELEASISRISKISYEARQALGQPGRYRAAARQVRINDPYRTSDGDQLVSELAKELHAELIETAELAGESRKRIELAGLAIELDGERAALCQLAARAAVYLGGLAGYFRECATEQAPRGPTDISRVAKDGEGADKP